MKKLFSFSKFRFYLLHFLLLFCISLFTFSNAALATCWVQAANHFDVDPLLLKAIAKVESSMNPKAINRNSNGTFDIGMMQINSIHLPRLESKGINKKRLINEPCLSVYVGAEILSGFIKQFGYNWKAVGAYNAGAKHSRESLRQNYAKKVWREYAKLISIRRNNKNLT